MYSIVSVCLETNISQTLRVNNLKTLWIKNAKFSGYYFYMNTNKYRDFQICISLPLRHTKAPSKIDSWWPRGVAFTTAQMRSAELKPRFCTGSKFWL